MSHLLLETSPINATKRDKRGREAWHRYTLALQVAQGLILGIDRIILDASNLLTALLREKRTELALKGQSNSSST